MPSDFYGLPLHPLVVHATVVLIPLAILTVSLSAVWPRFRDWAGLLPVGLSLIGLGLVPLSTSTGESLENQVARSALLERHTQIAEGLLPWMVALFALSAVGYFIRWRVKRGNSVGNSITVAVAVLALTAALGSAVQVARIGHSGAQAAWNTTNISSSTR